MDNLSFVSVCGSEKNQGSLDVSNSVLSPSSESPSVSVRLLPDDGQSTLSEMSSEPPILLRTTHTHQRETVYMVSPQTYPSLVLPPCIA